ncbi:MAG TPA: MoaD/ThiS family protein [Candidatus Baltobacteraceae bacterium]
MTVRVLAFARLRELLGSGEFALQLPQPSNAAAAWAVLRARQPAIAPLEASTRFARNGRLVGGNEPLAEGDEFALLPPVGGG